MPTLYMLSGPSASGKSTKAREILATDNNAVRINRDDLRKMSISKWTPKKEGWIIAAEVALAEAATKEGVNIVIDDTNLTKADEDRWKNLASSWKYDFKKIKFDVSIEECIKRDSTRGDAKVGPQVIERQFLKAKMWDVPAGKKTVIFDIDGTIADLTHRVGWIRVGGVCPGCKGSGKECCEKDGTPFCPPCKYCAGTGKLQKKNHDMFYGLVSKDPPIDIVVRWMKECYPDYYVLIVSGRGPERGCDEATVAWLAEHEIKYDHLIMRRSGMHGPDDQEKQRILDMILQIIPKEDIAFVVDDRPSVIEMWKKNGLRVIPVRGRDDEEFYKSESEKNG